MNAIPSPPLRLALLADFLQERWPSMDLCAEMLLEGLEARAGRVRPTLLRAPFAGRFGRLPLVGRTRAAWNADRLMGRFLDYPRWVRTWEAEFALFHVVDHSYAALLLALPPGRGGVYCHDLDAVRCLIEPHRDPRPGWFRAMARRILQGMQRAGLVFHSTQAVRAELLAHGLVEPARLVHAPLGAAPEMLPRGDLRAAEVAPGLAGRPFVLHVGSTIPRKRIDVLLRAFAGARASAPGLVLVQVGGTWTSSQRRLLEDLGLEEEVVLQLRGVARADLAALYRECRAVLLPSEAEGFGLPLLEALACGAAALASDLPVLREVGGDAASYVRPGQAQEWVEALRGALLGADDRSARQARVARAASFSWDLHAERILEAYERLVG